MNAGPSVQTSYINSRSTHISLDPKQNNNRSQTYNSRAEKQSGLTQNHVHEIA